MRFKGIVVLVVGLLFSMATVGQAQDEESASETSNWRWPEAGLSFEYPSEWQLIQAQGFQFVLVSEIPQSADQQPDFIGLQAGAVQDDQSLESVFDDIVATVEADATVEDIQFGGVDAYSTVVTSPDADQQTQFLGYQPNDDTIVLLVFSSGVETWEAFQETIDLIENSATVNYLDLDQAALDEELSENFAQDQTLTLGSDDAPVKMVEVLDFSCGHCVNFSSSVSRIINDKVLSGEVQYEMRYVTFVGAEFSENATHAQFCGTDQGFGWQMHKGIVDLYLENGGPQQGYTVDNLVGLATDLGADEEAFRTCVEDKAFADLLERDAAYASENDVTSTPTILLGSGDEAPNFIQNPDTGEPIRGAMPLYALYDFFDELNAGAESE